MALTAETPVKNKPVLIDPEAHEALQRLAETDHRTLGGEVQWLIEQEEQRRSTNSPEKRESTDA